MVKSTQNTAQKNSFVLSIYKSIKEENRLPKGKSFNCTDSNISYYSRKLMYLGIIKKKFPKGGIYEVLVDEKELNKRLKFNTKENFVTTKTKTSENLKYKRLHSIQVKLYLPKFNYWYKVLKTYLDKKGLPYDLNKKNQFRLTMIFEELKHTFLLCNDCIIFYLPNGKDFISDDVDFTIELAKIYINKLLSKFCGYFGKDLRIKGDFNFEITRKHIAMVDNAIAKRLRHKKRYLEVWVNGQLRLISDNSFNFNELEAITNNKAIDDVKATEMLLKDVITNGHTISDIKDLVINETTMLYKTIKDMQEVIKAQTDTIKLIAKERGFSEGEFYK